MNRGTMVDKQVAFMCDCSGEFYMEVVEGQYCVFGSESGFCYCAVDNCVTALDEVNALTMLQQLQQRRVK